MNWIELIQDGVQPIQSKQLPKKNSTLWNYLPQQPLVLSKADISQPLFVT
jgi:hypothetical protein